MAAIIARSGGVKIKGVGLNPTRDGAITILKEMGAKIHIENKRVLGNEPVADILSSDLRTKRPSDSSTSHSS